MTRFTISAALLALMTACAVERTDSTDSPASADGDPLSAANTATAEQASNIKPLLCAMPWEGPGAYYICTTTGGDWWLDRDACTASCGSLCELVAWCTAPCSCTPN